MGQRLIDQYIIWPSASPPSPPARRASKGKGARAQGRKGARAPLLALRARRKGRHESAAPARAPSSGQRNRGWVHPRPNLILILRQPTVGDRLDVAIRESNQVDAWVRRTQVGRVIGIGRQVGAERH